MVVRVVGVSDVAQVAVDVIEVAGVAVLAIGTVASTAHFLLRLRRKESTESAYRAYRVGLGRVILLGLELLVVADIIRTVAISATFESVAVLGLIVLIRTFLSLALEVELEGRWPWQNAGNRSPPDDERSDRPE